MNTLIENNINNIQQICRRFHVKNLYLFGSAASSSFNDQSDIDFLVTFDPVTLDDYSDNFFGLMYSLQETLKRKIDLVITSSLRNPYFIESVEESKVLIYDKGNQEVFV